jgi:hypothetical protein
MVDSGHDRLAATVRPDSVNGHLVQELIKTYDEYLNLLIDSEQAMIGLAFSHGYRNGLTDGTHG